MSKTKDAKVTDLIPDDRNLNKGSEYGHRLLESSLRQFGAGRSILIDRNNRIIAGNKTIEEAASIGMENVIIVETTGDNLVAVKRIDIDLDSKTGRELALADNAVGKANLVWDDEMLATVAEEWNIEPADWGVAVEAESPKKRWATGKSENVCDMSDALKLRKCGEFYFVSFWQKSDDGQLLSAIKSDEKMIEVFARKSVECISALLGNNLSGTGNWCMLTSPKRRNREMHFATEICREVAEILQIPFYEDAVVCKNRDRISPHFTLMKNIEQGNVIIFDDIFTTGSTFTEMHNCLSKKTVRKNCVFIAGIYNHD
jgi:hypothetical protein